MSIWRDIWKETIRANRIAAEKDDFSEYEVLYKKYGNDGMIHYAQAASYELKDDISNAVAEYKKAEELFRVDHWKKVAENSAARLTQGKTLEQFYNQTIFEEILWSAFQKIYRFIHLNDFARYIALSALSRGSSEWPLSLVDFRTVIELELKEYFSDIVEQIEPYTLFAVLKELEAQQKLQKGILSVLHKIRKAGNIAAHDLKVYETEKSANVRNFITALEFFNDFQNQQPRRKR